VVDGAFVGRPSILKIGSIGISKCERKSAAMKPRGDHKNTSPDAMPLRVSFDSLDEFVIAGLLWFAFVIYTF